MNNVNKLFVISAVFVPLLLISLNYESISDFYEYTIPLNSFVVEPNFSFGQDRIQKNLSRQRLTVLYYSQQEYLLL